MRMTITCLIADGPATSTVSTRGLWLARCALIASLLLAVVSQLKAQHHVGSGKDMETASHLSDAAHALIKKGIDTLARTGGRIRGRPASNLAYDCLFATELVRRGDRRFVPFIEARIDALLKSSRLRGDGVLTWGRRAEDGDPKKCPAGGVDSFNDGTCDPSDLPYAFQSGFAIACFARAGMVLGQPRLLEIARVAMGYWSQRSSRPKECAGCIYYWYSGNADDKDRYVRNTNVYLTLAAASLATAGRGSWTAVEQGLAAEAFERRMDNRGYLSALDPQWKRNASEADRTENHMAGIAAALLYVYNLSRKKQALDLALWNYATWAYCNNARCRRNLCSAWAGNPHYCAETLTFAHCAFRRYEPRAGQACEIAVTRSGDLFLNTYKLFLVLLGDPSASQ